MGEAYKMRNLLDCFHSDIVLVGFPEVRCCTLQVETCHQSARFPRLKQKNDQQLSSCGF